MEINQTTKSLFKSMSRPKYKIDRIIGVGKLTTGSCKGSIIKRFLLVRKCVILNLNFESLWEMLDRQCPDHMNMGVSEKKKKNKLTTYLFVPGFISISEITRGDRGLKMILLDLRFLLQGPCSSHQKLECPELL
jgi:hypothetical protein